MEFDIKQLSVLELEVVKVFANSRVQITIFALDFKSNEKLIIRVFESSEDENHVYKISKALYNTDVTAKIVLRNVINGYPYIVYNCLGPDLLKLFAHMNNSFSEQTVMLIGYRLVI